MDTDVKGQVGGLQANEEARRRFAKASAEWTCGSCRKSNSVIMREREEACKEAGEKAKEEVVPEELRLAYREDLVGEEKKSVEEVVEQRNETTTAASATPTTPQTTNAPQLQRAGLQQARRPADDAWIDKAIYSIATLLFLLVARKLLQFV